MSTRGAFGFKINGDYKITYNHSDSYPGGLGCGIVSIIKQIVKEKGLDKLKKEVSKVKIVDSESKPSKEQQKKYKSYADLSVSTGSMEKWYYLLRSIQGEETIKEIYKGRLGVMINNFDFLKDSLFCEYAYIINLDDNTMEFYKGFNRKPQRNNPLPLKQVRYNRGFGDKCYPVRFKSSCKLSRIPKNWSKKFYNE